MQTYFLTAQMVKSFINGSDVNQITFVFIRFGSFFQYVILINIQTVDARNLNIRLYSFMVFTMLRETE